MAVRAVHGRKKEERPMDPDDLLTEQELAELEESTLLSALANGTEPYDEYQCHFCTATFPTDSQREDHEDNAHGLNFDHDI